jgi:hypothetical protein
VKPRVLGQGIRKDLVRQGPVTSKAATPPSESLLPQLARGLSVSDGGGGRRGSRLPLLSARTRRCLDAVADSERVRLGRWERVC